jgi:hypothetical protein
MVILWLSGVIALKSAVTELMAEIDPRARSVAQTTGV